MLQHAGKHWQPFVRRRAGTLWRTPVINASCTGCTNFLLYVAMTRAVHALSMIMAPSRPNERTIPKTFAGIVRTALYGGAKADPEAVLYEHGMPDWQQKHIWPTVIDIPEMSASGSGEPEVLTIQLTRLSHGISGNLRCIIV